MFSKIKILQAIFIATKDGGGGGIFIARYPK
jgi:hypothetical protein